MNNIFEEAKELGVNIPKALEATELLLNTPGLPEESVNLLLNQLKSDLVYQALANKVKSAKEKASELAVEESIKNVESNLALICSDSLNELERLVTTFCDGESKSVIKDNGLVVSISVVATVKEDNEISLCTTRRVINPNSSKSRRNGSKNGKHDKIWVDGQLIENTRPWNVICEMVNQAKMDKGDSNRQLVTNHSETSTTYGWNNAVSMLPAKARHNYNQKEVNENLTKEEGLDLISQYLIKEIKLS